MGRRNEPIRVTRSSMPPFAEYAEMIRELWESHWLTNMGDFHQKLEKELKEYLQTRNLSLFVNGHLALEMAIQAFDLTGEVITTPFTFASTTHAIVRNGLTPVFCDIRADDYTLDFEKLESLITERTSAIIPVHVYGNLCNVEEIEAIAKRHQLKVIYDGAHAFGECLDQKGVASFGDACMFSFHATKVFNTIEGGAVAYQDPELACKINGLKNFGILDEETVAMVGGNGKMNEFQAAMGLCNLKHVQQEIEKRKQIYNRYKNRLSGISGIRLCPENPRVTKNYAYMPVVFEGYKKSRDQIFRELEEQGIYPRKYFYPCVNAYQCYRDRFRPEDTPVAKRISQEVLTLPMYADLPLDVVDEICDCILHRTKSKLGQA
ncbi:MAG: DegT/DnrJ/EryC1/StrS family aminotransferase [Lachnospiraceae bacterium]|jgi:dTDP-4-amino-4,6-dideoxygalactose transaminase|nr:DegT/DnrJ/EryC1/StrS family aminotransferase [Lachnospiraceae bacterium]